MIRINENIKKMAELLRSGNTMLNIACPVCNNPIFRNKDGNKFCPTCNRTVLMVKDNSNEANVVEKADIYQKKQENHLNNRKIESLNSLESVVFEKIEKITIKLSSETELSVIKSYTNILLNCLDILNKISIYREK
ncbi:MAG: Sjogren's syndrome/scleroderma autoantigen 1 family protein [Promethearchaeota archaeon]